MTNPNQGPVRPVFTKYRRLEVILCLVVVLMGVLYLYTELVSLWVLLPVFLAVFTAVPILRYKDEKTRGIHGPAVGISVAIAALPAIVVGAALVALLFL